MRRVRVAHTPVPVFPAISRYRTKYSLLIGCNVPDARARIRARLERCLGNPPDLFGSNVETLLDFRPNHVRLFFTAHHTAITQWCCYSIHHNIHQSFSSL
jgi:hypothetical protein